MYCARQFFDDETAAVAQHVASFPDWAVQMESLDAGASSYGYDLSVYAQPVSFSERSGAEYPDARYYFNRSQVSISAGFCSSLAPAITEGLFAHSSVNTINNVVYREATGTSGSILTAFVGLPFADYKYHIHPGTVGNQTWLIPLLAFIVWPMWVAAIAQEKHELLYHSMRIAGLRPLPYWAGTYVRPACVCAACVGVSMCRFRSVCVVSTSVLRRGRYTGCRLCLFSCVRSSCFARCCSTCWW